MKATNPFSMVKPQEQRDRFAQFEKDRAEFADIARAKLRQARHVHIPYSPQSERVIELLSDWSASFVQ